MKNSEQDVAFDTTDLEYNKDPQREMRSTIWMLIVMLIVLLLFAFIIPNFIYETFYVEGASMEPTFREEGDKVGLLKVGGYSYGDVVVVWADNEKDFNGKLPKSERIIKRVIGLPGDTVRFVNEDGKLYLNVTRTGSDLPGVTLYDEPYITGPNRREYANLSVDVKEGEVFVVGDNRQVSMDCLAIGKGLPADQVVGRVLILMRNNRLSLFDGKFQYREELEAQAAAYPLGTSESALSLPEAFAG